MLKVCKFGGSSVAGAEQFRKVRDIVLSDDSRRVVVISAAGKRTSDDHKLTDLLYLCHAHLTYGVSCADILAAIRSRFVSIRDELDLSYRVEDEFDAYAATLSRDTSVDELVSRGEYFTARLMAETLGYAFVDAADCVFFGFDGQFDRARTDAAISDALEKNGKIVLPGFYGRVPTGKIKVMTRGGSDITGALAAAALVYLEGGNPQQCADAAAFALMNLLGLVCDPVGGLVEVPCVYRNVGASGIAFTAADMVLSGIRCPIEPDEVILAMKEVGDALPTSLRETGEGGCAACESICKRLHHKE